MCIFFNNNVFPTRMYMYVCDEQKYNCFMTLHVCVKRRPAAAATSMRLHQTSEVFQIHKYSLWNTFWLDFILCRDMYFLLIVFWKFILEKKVLNWLFLIWIRLMLFNKYFNKVFTYFLESILYLKYLLESIFFKYFHKSTLPSSARLWFNSASAAAAHAKDARLNLCGTQRTQTKRVRGRAANADGNYL